MKAPRKKKPAAKQTAARPGGNASAPPQLSRGKLWLFRLFMAFGIPVLLLVLTELLLRVAGFGYPTGFLLTSDRHGEKVFVQNNQFGWRFFGPAMARNPEPFCIPKIKSTNTVRIIVFGESAALGDPQPRFGLARMLEAMLELRYPGTHFEVVNAGIVAIDSNVILPIARDCAGAGADIWVVYMGNNEVVGPYGAGTIFGQQVPPLSVIRANLALRSLRLGQMIDSLRAAILKPPVDQSQWGGMEMFLNQQVPEKDPRMHAVYNHFARNLSDIIRAGRNSGAGLVVSTVAVNLKDCAPFASAHRMGLSDAEKSKWEQLYKDGMAAQAAGKMDAALQSYRDAANIDDRYAELSFCEGQCVLATGQTADAQKLFLAARDEDTLRFRCDNQLNQLIRKTVADAGDEKVLLADAETAFAAESPGGLPGNNLFYEHVHLNFDGNYLLARTMAPSLEKLLPANIAGSASAAQPWPTEADCARRLAWSDWDKYEAFNEIVSRLGKPPFNSQANHDEQVQRLEAALHALMPAHEMPGIQKAEKLCSNALETEPDDALLHQQLAALNQLSDDLGNAQKNAEAAVDLLPSSSEDWSQLGVILAKQKKYDDAIAAFRRAFQLNSRDVWTLQNLAQALKDVGRRDEAIREFRHAIAVNPRFGLAWMGLGQALEEAGKKQEAEACYRKAVANPINRAPELETLARLCLSRGWREEAATNYEALVQLEPLNPQVYLEAGQNLAALGHHPAAEQYFAKAAKLSPDSLQAHFLYGMELGQNGKPAEAAKEFREAVRIMPDLAEARLNLAMALENAGNYSEALAEFEKVLAAHPDNALARDHINALKQIQAQK